MHPILLENRIWRDSTIRSEESSLNRIRVLCPNIVPTAFFKLEFINSFACLIYSCSAAVWLNCPTSSSSGTFSWFFLRWANSSAERLVMNLESQEPRLDLKLRSAFRRAGRYTHWISSNGSQSNMLLQELPPHLLGLNNLLESALYWYSTFNFALNWGVNHVRYSILCVSSKSEKIAETEMAMLAKRLHYTLDRKLLHGALCEKTQIYLAKSE